MFHCASIVDRRGRVVTHDGRVVFELPDGGQDMSLGMFAQHTATIDTAQAAACATAIESDAYVVIVTDVLRTDVFGGRVRVTSKGSKARGARKPGTLQTEPTQVERVWKQFMWDVLTSVWAVGYAIVRWEMKSKSPVGLEPVVVRPGQLQVTLVHYQINKDSPVQTAYRLTTHPSAVDVLRTIVDTNVALYVRDPPTPEGQLTSKMSVVAPWSAEYEHRRAIHNSRTMLAAHRPIVVRRQQGNPTDVLGRATAAADLARGGLHLTDADRRMASHPATHNLLANRAFMDPSALQAMLSGECINMLPGPNEMQPGASRLVELYPGSDVQRHDIGGHAPPEAEYRAICELHGDMVSAAFGVPVTAWRTGGSSTSHGATRGLAEITRHQVRRHARAIGQWLAGIANAQFALMARPAALAHAKKCEREGDHKGVRDTTDTFFGIQITIDGRPALSELDHLYESGFITADQYATYMAEAMRIPKSALQVPPKPPILPAAPGANAATKPRDPDADNADER